MADIEPYVLYAVQVSTTAQAGTAVYIDQITNYNISTGLREIVEAADGSVDATFAAVMGADPVLTFTTSDLKALLDLATGDGLHITSDEVDDPGVTLWLQALDEGGTRKSGANHIKVVIGNGILVPRIISATHDGGPATATFDVLPISSDGSTTPVAVTGSVALEGTPTVSALWTLGTCKVRNSDLPAVDLTIDYGIDARREGADGLPYATYSYIMSRRPTITFTSPNVGAFATYGIAGLAVSATTVVYFRKMSEGGTRVAVATEEHISCTVAQGDISIRTISGAHGQRLGAAMQITPTYNDSNAVIAWDTTAAIV